MNKSNKKEKIAVVGLGYVGLPLAVEFSRKYQVIGFDINKARIEELNSVVDKTTEIDPYLLEELIITSKTELLDSDNGLFFTADLNNLEDANIYIITVPTPINNNQEPDLSFLISASQEVGQSLNKDDIVIYESTVYPGCTEEECVPILEEVSGLKYNKDFFCGYSPERISPGDKIHTLTNITKVTSGSTPRIAESIDKLYQSIIDAGTYLAPSIKVAEASKAIENAQRDINISFMNELSLIFDRMGLDTYEVLKAAKTKWNFLPFTPGLVGGHCISVDPYYLVYKAQRLGYQPSIILSGRDVNNQMGVFVALKTIDLIEKRGKKIEYSRILILGITFKENCPDIRNSRVIDIYNQLVGRGAVVDVHDPNADKDEVNTEFGISLTDEIGKTRYCAILFVVAHDIFLKPRYQDLLNEETIIFDLKGTLKSKYIDARL